MKIHKLALFGQPVKHSLSPIIHTDFAEQFGLTIDYQLQEVNADDLSKTVNNFFAKGGLGANITLPHKRNIIPILKSINSLAEIAQAVNTIYSDKNKQLNGANTDGIGFVNDLNKRCSFTCKDKKILILGAGGACAGIVPAIVETNPKTIVIANRSVEKAEFIANNPFNQALTQAISLLDLKNLEQTFDLIIHASSLGHHGKTLKFHAQNIHKQTIAYDLSYGKAAQPFLALCKKQKINQAYDGIGMLIEQAAVAFEIWFNKKPQTAQIFQKLKDIG